MTPIFKSGNKELLTNYRPISVLPCFSKILERIMYNRLYDHFNQNNLLFEKKFGFRSSHSTEHAVVELFDELINSFDNKNFTLGVFIDLSKAFDTVNHEILLKKLQSYGIIGNHLNWFKSYLRERKQFIANAQSKTELKIIQCGVPQGSILGPLLFLIYINDLFKSSPVLKFIMFADDTNLFFSHKDVNSLYETVNIELEKVNIWFKANKLSLNVSKTNYILFHQKRKEDYLPLRLPSLTINNCEINRVTKTKFLGLIVDEHLTWNEHIKVVEKQDFKKSRNIV